MKVKPIKLERYLHPVAQIHLLSTAAYKTWLAGRGSSKSFTNGLKIGMYIELMPGSVGLFNSPTYSMIYTKTLIPMKAAWEQHLGYIEDVHYVVGKVPPKHFARPWHKPHRYENVVTFWNGTTVVFGSFDRPSLISGGSYDWVITDEAYLIEKTEYDDFVIPAVRPTHPSFKNCPYHLQQSFTSSMPYKNQGDWLLEYRIKALANPAMYHFIGWEPNVKVQLGSTYMNVKVLGEKTIQQWEAEMNEHSLNVMIHNQQVTNWGDTFYPSLSPKHWYTPKANENIILPLGSFLNFKRSAVHDESPDDYDNDLPIHISHDWGAFNCITIDQVHPREIRFINKMHVHHPKTIDDLADEFCEYYRYHKCRVVYQWGDKSGNVKVPNSDKTFFEQFAERLRNAKRLKEKGWGEPWRVVRKKIGDVDQLERHRFLSLLHREENPAWPKVRHNSKCHDLKVALESAGMKDKQKDKSSERNPAIKPEHATHYTDAYDYRLYHGFIYLEKKTYGADPHSTSVD
jgi:hypothetical protein